MTMQGVAAAGAGALAELVASGYVIAFAGAASVVATILLWRQLSPNLADHHDTDISP